MTHSGAGTSAAHLAKLFKDHGPPLFIKRDNGGNLNHHKIEELLCAFLVIPVNSPCYYPQYSGCIEADNRQIKSRLQQHVDQTPPLLAVQNALDIETMNHKRCPTLKYRTPCAVFTSGWELARSYNRRKRKEVYDSIKEKTLELIRQKQYHADTAWRLAVETWLLEHRYITVSKKGKV